MTTIKLYTDEQIRRFSLTERSYNALVTSIRSLLDLSPEEEFTLKYTDEGDKITFSSEEEFEYLVSHFNQPFRIYYEKKKAQTNSEIAENSLNITNQKSENILSSEEEQKFIELKGKLCESHRNLKIAKENLRVLKTENNKLKDQLANLEVTNEHPKDITEDMKRIKFEIFQQQLQIYEMKLSRRAILKQLQPLRQKQREVRQNSKHPRCQSKFHPILSQFASFERSQKGSGGSEGQHPQENHCKRGRMWGNPEFRQQVWEIKEKKNTLKIQKRSLKLMLNDYTSPQQREYIQNQITQLNHQIYQLREQKFNLFSQFRQKREQTHSNSNNNNSNNDNQERTTSPMPFCFGGFRHLKQDPEFQALRNQMFGLRKQLKEMKLCSDLKTNQEKQLLYRDLKSKIQELRPQMKACRQKVWFDHLQKDFPQN